MQLIFLCAFSLTSEWTPNQGKKNHMNRKGKKRPWASRALSSRSGIWPNAKRWINCWWINTSTHLCSTLKIVNSRAQSLIKSLRYSYIRFHHIGFKHSHKMTVTVYRSLPTELSNAPLEHGLCESNPLASERLGFPFRNNSVIQDLDAIMSCQPSGVAWVCYIAKYITNRSLE